MVTYCYNLHNRSVWPDYEWMKLWDALNSFIHSGHFYSAPSSPLPLRGAPDYSTDTVSEFHAEAHECCLCNCDCLWISRSRLLEYGIRFMVCVYVVVEFEFTIDWHCMKLSSDVDLGHGWSGAFPELRSGVLPRSWLLYSCLWRHYSNDLQIAGQLEGRVPHPVVSAWSRTLSVCRPR